MTERKFWIVDVAFAEIRRGRKNSETFVPWHKNFFEFDKDISPAWLSSVWWYVMWDTEASNCNQRGFNQFLAEVHNSSQTATTDWHFHIAMGQVQTKTAAAVFCFDIIPSSHNHGPSHGYSETFIELDIVQASMFYVESQKVEESCMRGWVNPSIGVTGHSL